MAAPRAATSPQDPLANQSHQPLGQGWPRRRLLDTQLVRRQPPPRMLHSYMARLCRAGAVGISAPAVIAEPAMRRAGPRGRSRARYEKHGGARDQQDRCQSSHLNILACPAQPEFRLIIRRQRPQLSPGRKGIIRLFWRRRWNQLSRDLPFAFSDAESAPRAKSRSKKSGRTPARRGYCRTRWRPEADPASPACPGRACAPAPA